MIRWKDLFAALLVGSGANFPWELAHSLLYRSVAGFTWPQHLVCCGLASIMDGLGIAAIYCTGAAVFRDPRWTRRLTPMGVMLALLLGLTGAALTEQVALRLDWWSYGPAMPRVPGTDLGISPLVQFLVLPPGVLFWALPRWWDHADRAGGATEA